MVKNPLGRGFFIGIKKPARCRQREMEITLPPVSGEFVLWFVIENQCCLSIRLKDMSFFIQEIIFFADTASTDLLRLGFRSGR